MRLVGLAAAVPDEVDAIGVELERQVQDLEPAEFREHMGARARHHAEQIRARDDERDRDDVVGRDGETPLDAARRERAVDDVAHRRPHVAQRRVFLEADPLPDLGVVAARDRDERVEKQRVPAPARRNRRHGADREVEVVRLQELRCAAAPDIFRHHVDTRCFHCDLFDQRRQEENGGEVDEPDAELARQGRDVEIVLERRFDAFQRFRNVGRDFDRAVGRLHEAADADEQPVAVAFAQPAERVAHRRLREPDIRGGVGDVPVLHERPEHDQRVEVEPANMHGANYFMAIINFNNAGTSVMPSAAVCAVLPGGRS